MTQDRAASGTAPAYDPKGSHLVPFFAAIPSFRDGSDTPRAYLERCLEAVDARDGEVKAFVVLNVEGARKAADAASARYKAGRPLSAVDGMPLGVKDVIETEDLPTGNGSPIFEGWQSGWDAACVYWLRRGGAVVVGKTVTTEFATVAPGPTRNPWDLSRTPGGSSSGSGAAVGAGMLPAALGTQVRGSVLRPAAYCGVFALKPSLGTINLHGISPFSRGINHLGALAASLEDAWLTIHYVSVTGGGEAGHHGLTGPTEVPEPRRPRRVARVETAGWASTPEPSRAAFERLVDSLRREDVEIVGRREDKEIEAFEADCEQILPVTMALRSFESRYPLLYYGDRYPDKLSGFSKERLPEMETLTAEDYHRALDWTLGFRARYAGLADTYDALLTLTSSGPAPIGEGTGDPAFCDPWSVTGAPSLNLPLLAVDGLPQGVQLAGFHLADRELVARGLWLSRLFVSL